MSSMIDDISHLSREIGARPAGTEEERLAAMYIAENMQKRSALPFDIEDFEGAKGSKRVINILSIVSAILLFLSVLLPVVSVPALIICLVIAVIVVMEYLGRPIVSNFFRYGISQNVVSKYVPAYSSENSQSQRKRKVVFVSHYDSGRSVPESGDSFFKLAYMSNIAALFADCLIVVFLAIKAFAFPETSGVVTLVCVIVSLILAIVCILPSLVDFYKSKLLYNEGANCNASGNAVLIEIARQLGTGAYATDEDFSQDKPRPVVHGKDAAAEADVIPAGANLNYEVPKASSKEEKPAEEKKDALAEKEQSLEDAKAAVAAFTAPRKPRAQFDEEGNVIDEGIKTSEESTELQNVTIDDASAQRTEASAETTSSIPAYKTEKKGSGDVPDWFKSAQSKAKKNDRENEDQKAEKRSKFAHTMDVMAEKQEKEEQKKKDEEEKKRAELRAQIEAANKAAEEERQKKMADKKTFYRSEEDKENTTGMPAVEEKKEEKKEEVSLEDSFKQSFVQKTEKNDEEKKVEDKKEEELKPEDSGQINLDEMRQYAPLDDQDFISSNEMPQNEALKELPEVFTDEENIEENPEYAKALQEDDAKEAKVDDGSVEKGKFGTGSFAAVSEAEGVAGATGTFAPVQEELIEDASRSGEIASKEEMVIADADDSVYNEGEFTDTGAFAGKGYVNMPDEKRKGLFGRFKKDKGAGRHASEGDGFIDSTSNKGDKFIDEADWEGGAFANIGNKFKRNKKDDVNELDGEFVDEVQDAPQDFEEQEILKADPNAPITSDQNHINSMVDPVPDFDKQIQEFHNASINMEVWMVALGSEIDENAGIKAFLMEHAQELRGAIIIDIEGLGAGELSLVNSEGLVRKSQTSSRMKRYVRSAANKLGVVVPSVDLPWGESSAAYASKLGYKTLRLVGMDGSKPAYYMSKDDVVENIDEGKLQSNVKYLLQLIQSI